MQAEFDQLIYLENEASVIRVHANIFRKRATYDELIKYVVGVITQATPTFDIYVNLDKIKPYHLDFDFIKDFVVLLQQIFPNRLNKCYVINCSALCKTIYESCKMFIDKNTHRKIQFMQTPTVESQSSY